MDIKSFLKVTGPKKESWLVKTFGLMICCMAIAFITAAFRKEDSYTVKLLAMVSAAALMIADVYYVRKAAIRSVYLLDAAVELLILFGWFAVSV